MTPAPPILAVQQLGDEAHVELRRRMLERSISRGRDAQLRDAFRHLHADLEKEFRDVPTLSRCQMEVFTFLGEGMGQLAIANRLQTKKQSVDNHSNRAQAKLGAIGLHRLIAFAARYRLYQQLCTTTFASSAVAAIPLRAS